ncbi:MAG: tRNA pseudouridine(55) synthase TruB [Oscillospiraceae bacterium]|nr:tRNA pseudouridine(55) synthase TruB [Oscillospiraceae bacterium]
MTGIICVNKPQEFTSFDVVASMRRCFGTKKMGHGGTLDPMATGVLPVFVGGATKAVDLVPDDSKSYRAGFRLGLVSDTQDIWGKLRSRCENGISEAEIQFALEDFRGEIMQIPPMYSALKVNGQKLCDLARRGIEVERKPRPVTISRLELASFDGTDGVLEVDCSGGTYIRTLINDIGEALGTGAIMTSLCRTKSCGFTLESCHGLEEIRGADREQLERWLIPVEAVFAELPEIPLDEVQRRMYLNGVRLDADRLMKRSGTGILSRVTFGGEFLGVGRINTDGELVPVKQFRSE